MLRGQRRATVRECHPGLAAHEIRQRQVRGVAAVAERGYIRPIRLNAVEERIDRHPLPDRVELAPFGNAVDIDGDRLAGERAELIPGPAPRRLDGSGDREVPLREGRVRGRPGGKDREVGGDVLPRWDPAGDGGVLAPAATKPTRDKILYHAPAPASSPRIWFRDTTLSTSARCYLAMFRALAGVMRRGTLFRGRDRLWHRACLRRFADAASERQLTPDPAPIGRRRMKPCTKSTQVADRHARDRRRH